MSMCRNDLRGVDSYLYLGESGLESAMTLMVLDTERTSVVSFYLIFSPILRRWFPPSPEPFSSYYPIRSRTRFEGHEKLECFATNELGIYPHRLRLPFPQTPSQSARACITLHTSRTRPPGFKVKLHARTQRQPPYVFMSKAKLNGTFITPRPP